MPEDIDCPGFQDFVGTFSASQRGDGPLAAFLHALIVLAQEVSEPGARPPCPSRLTRCWS
jgi:hypothetical protein